MSIAGTYSATGHVETCPDINGPACAAMPVAAQWHDLKLFFGDLRVHAEYGILDWLSVDLMWSLRVVHTQFQLQDAATRVPIASPFGEELHHRSETIVGLADPWLSLRAVKLLGPWAFVFRAGATLPVGSTVDNPFRLAREGKSHQHIQLGTGTVDPFVEVEVRRVIRRFTLSAWLLGKAAVYENTHGYRAGAQLQGGVDLASGLWTSRWTFSLGVLAYHEEAERWSGDVETEGNLGRTDLMLNTSVAWRFVGDWSIALGARVPFQSWAVGAQLTTPAVGVLTVSRPFDLRWPRRAR